MRRSLSLSSVLSLVFLCFFSSCWVEKRRGKLKIRKGKRKKFERRRGERKRDKRWMLLSWLRVCLSSSSASRKKKKKKRTISYQKNVENNTSCPSARAKKKERKDCSFSSDIEVEEAEGKDEEAEGKGGEQFVLLFLSLFERRGRKRSEVSSSLLRCLKRKFFSRSCQRVLSLSLLVRTKRGRKKERRAICYFSPMGDSWMHA